MKLLLLGLLVAALILYLAHDQNSHAATRPSAGLPIVNERLKKEVLTILENKCNVCHLKQNPSMIFKEKNMSKRAPKIYKMVFQERRMPKGNKIPLTNEENATLEKWLFTQNIF